MKDIFKKIQSDSVLQWSFWTTLFFSVLMIIAIAGAYVNLPPFLPLYNQMPWGYARLGKTYEFFSLPAGILLVLAVNTFIGIRLAGKIPLLARFLFLTMVTLSFLELVFVVRIILLVL